MAETRVRDREQQAAYNRAYYAANRARLNERNREYRQRNAEAIAAQRQVAYLANQEAERAKRRAVYQANPAKSKAQMAAYRKANPEKYRAQKQRWRDANREADRSSKRAWARRNPDKINDDAARRRARIRGGVTENVQRAVVWERDEGTCHICSEPADRNDWHLDHIVPIIRGGAHTYANVAVSHPSCNLRKQARLMEELTRG